MCALYIELGHNPNYLRDNSNEPNFSVLCPMQVAIILLSHLYTHSLTFSKYEVEKKNQNYK